MKFYVSRTSANHAPKHDDYQSIEKVKTPNGNEWLYYVVEISTLEELMDYIEKHDERVVIERECLLDDGSWTIEIYDDWRE